MVKINYLSTNKKRRQLELKCIEKCFYLILPNLQAISNNKIFKKIIGGDINSLGVEGALEAYIGLFKDGRLQLKAKSIEDFIVFIMTENEVMVVYDTNEE